LQGLGRITLSFSHPIYFVELFIIPDLLDSTLKLRVKEDIKWIVPGSLKFEDCFYLKAPEVANLR
jgi:hypothetical protein